MTDKLLQYTRTKFFKISPLLELFYFNKKYPDTYKNLSLRSSKFVFKIYSSTITYELDSGRIKFYTMKIPWELTCVSARVRRRL